MLALLHRCDKKRAELKGKALYLPIDPVPTLTYSHEGWVMTERMRSQIEEDEMGFLNRVAGLSLMDNVRSLVNHEGLGVELLLLCIERS